MKHLSPLWWPNRYGYDSSGRPRLDQNWTTFNAENDQCAAMFYAPDDLTITHFGFRTRASNATDDIQCRLEARGTTNQYPDGTLYHADAHGTITNVPANTNHEVAINGGTGVSITRGDPIWMLLKAVNTYTGSITMARYGDFGGTGNSAGTFTVENENSSWLIDNDTLPWGLKSSENGWEDLGSQYFFGGTSAGTLNHTAIEFGARFKLPCDATLRIMDFKIEADNEFTIELYEDGEAPGSGTTLSTPYPSTAAIQTKTDVIHNNVFLGVQPRLKGGKWYRITFRHTTGVNALNHCVFGDDEEHMRCAGLTGQFYYTKDNGAGGWTDETNRWPFMWLGLFDMVITGPQIIQPGAFNVFA